MAGTGDGECTLRSSRESLVWLVWLVALPYPPAAKGEWKSLWKQRPSLPAGENIEAKTSTVRIYYVAARSVPRFGHGRAQRSRLASESASLRSSPRGLCLLRCCCRFVGLRRWGVVGGGVVPGYRYLVDSDGAREELVWGTDMEKRIRLPACRAGASFSASEDSPYIGGIIGIDAAPARSVFTRHLAAGHAVRASRSARTKERRECWVDDGQFRLSFFS